jgi:hypothetical protein
MPSNLTISCAFRHHAPERKSSLRCSLVSSVRVPAEGIGPPASGRKGGGDLLSAQVTQAPFDRQPLPREVPAGALAGATAVPERILESFPGNGSAQQTGRETDPRPGLESALGCVRCCAAAEPLRRRRRGLWPSGAGRGSSSRAGPCWASGRAAQSAPRSRRGSVRCGFPSSRVAPTLLTR